MQVGRFGTKLDRPKNLVFSGVFKVNPYNMIERIPSEFWSHKQFEKLPSRSQYRQKLCQKLVDGEHKKKCIRLEDDPKDFHLESKEFCICKFCGMQLSWYHECVTDDTT